MENQKNNQTKKSIYNSLAEWKNADHSGYKIASSKKLLPQICKMFGWKFRQTLPRGYWTKEKCLEDSKKYTTAKEWNENSSTAYSTAYANGWLKECRAHMTQLINPANFWTKKRCLEDARKYKTSIKWRRKSSSCYDAAIRNGWVEECKVHMITQMLPKGYWTKERCLEDSKKYSSRKEWAKKSPKSYSAAIRLGWYKECSTHMKKIKNAVVKGFWTKEKCLEEAKKYSSKTEWRKNSTGYSAAWVKGWLKDCKFKTT